MSVRSAFGKTEWSLPRDMLSPEVADMAPRPSVLIVSGNSALLDSWASWVEYEGFEVVSCPGPGILRCPRLAGERCEYRERADVAVIDVEPLSTSRLYERGLERSCTTDPDDGRTIFVVDPLAHPQHPSVLVRAVRETLR